MRRFSRLALLSVVALSGSPFSLAQEKAAGTLRPSVTDVKKKKPGGKAAIPSRVRNATIPASELRKVEIRDAGHGRPFWDVNVHQEHKSTLDAETLATWKQLADQFSKVTDVPEDRLKFWSVYNTEPYRIERWVGMPTDVQRVDGGHLVTLRVSPIVKDRKMIFGQYGYVETYFVDQQGKIAYRGFADPYHQAGKNIPFFQ